MEGFNLDIRGNNGYVIVPPGENKNGKYEFINSGTKTLAELPEKIIKLINSKKSKRIEIKEKIPAVKHFEKPRKKNIEKEPWANKEIDNIIKNINLNIISNLFITRDTYLQNNNLTILDESPFQEFIINCIGKTYNILRENRIKNITKEKKFYYIPSSNKKKIIWNIKDIFNGKRI
jgi:hypothetical protein